jgi:hypothetical protein
VSVSREYLPHFRSQGACKRICRPTECDGKLQIEALPELYLTSPLTCVQFVTGA